MACFGDLPRRLAAGSRAFTAALRAPVVDDTLTVGDDPRPETLRLAVGDGDDAAVQQQLLDEARARVEKLENELAASRLRPLPPLSPCGDKSPSRKTTKIFIDGVFDLMHFGHMNAFRQARSLGSYLIVGVNSDESVAVCKGSLPVLSDAERQQAVAACRFVDEIIPASPYVMSAAYIQELIEKYDIDYFVHGDDPCIVDGKDVYEDVKKAGRFKSIPRTDGISTTDIAGRTLLLTKEHHKEKVAEICAEDSDGSPGGPAIVSTLSSMSQFLVTSQLMQAFSAALPERSLGQKRTVYVDGAWDMFHTGHISLLQQAKALGDRLVVGVHSDAVVNEQRGFNYPILAMNERVLSVLGCRYVDDVLLDAPWVITEEMVATLKISVVVRGTEHDCADIATADPRDPHAIPIRLGIHQVLQSKNKTTVGDIVQRLQAPDRKSVV